MGRPLKYGEPIYRRVIFVKKKIVDLFEKARKEGKSAGDCVEEWAPKGATDGKEK